MFLSFTACLSVKPQPNGPKQTSSESPLQSTLHFPVKKESPVEKKTMKHLVPKSIRVYISSFIYGWETEPRIWGRGSSLVTCTLSPQERKKTQCMPNRRNPNWCLSTPNLKLPSRNDMKCPFPHCRTVILSSLDKLKEADKHIFTHGKVKAVCVKMKGLISGFCRCWRSHQVCERSIWVLHMLLCNTLCTL